MAQRQEEDRSDESAGRRSEEESMVTEEKILAGVVVLEQRKAAEAVEERSSDGDGDGSEEDAVEAPAWWRSLLAHPCSLLQFVIVACGCRLSDPFRRPKPSAAPAGDSPPALESSGEDDAKTAAGFMQEVVARLRSATRPPRSPGNPREGTGGNGGHVH